MATTDFLPGREAELVTWSTNFSDRINATPTAFGLTGAQATNYDTVHLAFVAAYQASANDATNSRSATIIKRDAKRVLIETARMLARIVQATPSVTNGQRSDLGLNVRDVEPTPAPVPQTAPAITIESTLGWTVTLRLRDVDAPTSRAKPPHVAGANVFSFVGAVAPSEISMWKFEGGTSRTTFDVTFDTALEPGTKVWITAFWFNPRLQSGPAATPATTQVNYGGLAQAA